MAWPPGASLSGPMPGVVSEEQVARRLNRADAPAAGLAAASLAVGEECFSREESCLVGERLAAEVICGDGVLETAVPDGWPPARASGCTEPGLQASSPAARPGNLRAAVIVLRLRRQNVLRV
jgi:hypothetical protein